MRFYTLHWRGDKHFSEGNLIVIKEGFSWPAFFLGPIWALWHKLWWVVGSLTIILIPFFEFSYFLDASAVTILIILSCCAWGLTGNDIRRYVLRLEGFEEVDVVGALCQELAIKQHYEDIHSKDYHLPK